MNILVVQNAIGRLDNLLGKAKDALQQIEAEAYGHETLSGYENAAGALGSYLDELGHALSVVLEASEMPAARALLRSAWTRFKKSPGGLGNTKLVSDTITSDAVTYAEHLIEALRMSVIRDMTTGESWTLRRLCSRFRLVADQLSRRRQSRPTLEIKDEYDVQDLLHALLRLNFDDVRPEEWTPSYGGVASRMDFLLKEEQIVVETKMTRAGLGAREISNELIIDVARYRVYPDCKVLICLVYDPKAIVQNPRGVERDIGRLSDANLQVICVVVQ